MPILAQFALSKQYDDLQVLTEAELDAAFIDAGVTSCQGFINTKLVNNIIQLATDSIGSGIVFTDNGTAQFTNSLFQKQNSTNLYNGGDISIGTSADVAFVNVDAVNAAISFTPERIGQYRLVANFSHTFKLTIATEGECETIFQLTDGTLRTPIVKSGGYYPVTTSVGTQISISTPLSITGIFNWTDINPKTITLQKWVKTASNISSQIIGGSSSNGEIYLMIEKI